MGTKAAAAAKPRPSIRAIQMGRLKEDTLRQNAERLHALLEMSPPPAKLSTKEELVRGIAGWMAENGDPEQSADCSVCGGVMDMRLIDSKSLPPCCIYCGVSVDDEGGDRADVKSSPVASVVPKTQGPSTTALAKAPEASLAKLSTEQQKLVGEIDAVRARLTGAVEAVHTEMWKTGKWLAELHASGRWAKHPKGFESWEAFVTTAFGGLVTTRRANELMAYASANEERPPELAQRMLLPALPKPRAANEGGPPTASAAAGGERPAAAPPTEIALSGRAPLAAKLKFLTEAGKPAAKLADGLTCVEELPCGVIQRFTLARDRAGNLELRVKRQHG